MTAVLTLWLPSLVQASGVRDDLGVVVLLGINFSVLVWFFSLFSTALVHYRGWCSGGLSTGEGRTLHAGATGDGDDLELAQRRRATVAAGSRPQEGGGGDRGGLSAAGQVVPVKGELQRCSSGGAFRQLQQHRRSGNTDRQLQRRPSGSQSLQLAHSVEGRLARGFAAGLTRLSSSVQGGGAGSGVPGGGVLVPAAPTQHRPSDSPVAAAGAGAVEQQLREQARVATLVENASQPQQRREDVSELQQSARVAAIAVDDVVNESPTCLQRPDLQQQQRRRPSGSQAVEAGHDNETERRRVKKRRHRRKGKHKKHRRHHRRVQE